MRVKGFVQKDCAFTGHSLGEYSALASIADVLHISALVDVVFYRGITMQRAVERDSENRSNYAMCAVNPSRVLTTFFFLQEGDICRPEARILSVPVTNSSEGKIVKVKGHCYRNNHISSIAVVLSTTKTPSTLPRSLITH
jgi:Acyl transferase domain